MSLSRRSLLKTIGLAWTGSVLAPFPDVSGSSTRSLRIVIAGGGHAGATAARYLRKHLPHASITLVEKNPVHVDCPASNLVIAGWRDYGLLFSRYDNVSRQNINIIHASITGNDPQRRRLKLESGIQLEYDRLIMAPGISLDWNALPGLEDGRHLQMNHAWIAGPQTLALKRQIESLPSGGTFIMTIPHAPYRCPPGPYERASLIASRLRITNPRAKILLIDGKKSFSKQKGFKAAWDELYPGMIEWISVEQEGPIDHIDVANLTVNTAFGKHKADVLNVIPPQRAGHLASLCELNDASGWCPVDTLDFSSTLAPDTYVIGDACQAGPMPKSAFAGNTQAKVCAAAIATTANGDTPLASPLINHCFSLVSPEKAISITGLYKHDRDKRQLLTLSLEESGTGDDRRKEAKNTYEWYEHFKQDCFG